MTQDDDVDEKENENPMSGFWSFTGQGLGIMLACIGLAVAMWACTGFKPFWLV